MRLWVTGNDNGVSVNFMADDKEELLTLDRFLGFDPSKHSNFPIFDRPIRNVNDGAIQTANLIGHETFRAIVVEMEHGIVTKKL
jgi:hypothetical protein